MKVLLINNYHYLRGGAEKAYFDLGKILEKNGHEVACFSTLSEKNCPSKWSSYFIKGYDLEGKHGWLRKIIIASNIIYNFEAKKNIARLIKDFKPDIAHLHNIYHHLSPSIILALKKRKVPIVLTLHDYKLISPNRNLYCHGKVWEKDKGGKYYRCFFDKTVKNSYLKSLVCVIEAYLHKGTKIYGQVDRFVAPSHFLINKFKQYGFKKDITYLFNPLEEPNDALSDDVADANNENNHKKYFLYFGRLNEEKGVGDLIEAIKLTDSKWRLLVAGTGEEEGRLKKAEDGLIKSGQIEFLGYKSGRELKELIKGALAVVMPSRWPENAPYSLLEALLLKKIVISANVGGINEIVEDKKTGFLYPAGNVEILANIIDKIAKNGKELGQIGEQASKWVKDNRSNAEFYGNLINIYIEAIKEHK